MGELASLQIGAVGPDLKKERLSMFKVVIYALVLKVSCGKRLCESRVNAGSVPLSLNHVMAMIIICIAHAYD